MLKLRKKVLKLELPAGTTQTTFIGSAINPEIEFQNQFVPVKVEVCVKYTSSAGSKFLIPEATDILLTGSNNGEKIVLAFLPTNLPINEVEITREIWHTAGVYRMDISANQLWGQMLTINYNTAPAPSSGTFTVTDIIFYYLEK